MYINKQTTAARQLVTTLGTWPRGECVRACVRVVSAMMMILGGESDDDSDELLQQYLVGHSAILSPSTVQCLLTCMS